ncbi:hypothetical protein B0J11DRAFT_527525 [Dendryphion nanum]|uniref:Uncharacterized protein n=1 Tax=Dendryphion nanum TaxID=256645 RepID=A0A9P9INM2_9PLEO|nr:hypothetical protein B0J11DRAFT_527525 [Dendryphion nanum]
MRPTNIVPPTVSLPSRPAVEEKLSSFSAVNHLQHREQCYLERLGSPPPYETPVSFMDLSEEPEVTFRARLRKMYTIFPLRDPIYLVTIVFTLGSLDLVINAFFDLLPRTVPSTFFATSETIAVPTTVLIGSIFFFVAGILDTFAALNADNGTLETSKSPNPDGETIATHTSYKPALLFTPEWTWRPSSEKFSLLASTNLAFQAGLIVLFGGIIFMMAGITDFPGVVPSSSLFFGTLVFAPQAVHGALFFLANGLLALSLQEKWWRPKWSDADWQGAMLNTIGGLGFMFAGLLLFGTERGGGMGMDGSMGVDMGDVMLEARNELEGVFGMMDGALGGEIRSAVAAMVGSVAFLFGSVLRWWVVMEIY